jgi:hypothetical protein
MANIPAASNWKLQRTNAVVSTAAGNPTVVTVVGDSSGVGSGTDDHGAQNGVLMTLQGFATPGAAALNGNYVITRLSATSFSVPVATSTSTAGEGSYSWTSGFKAPPWRMSYSMYVVDWMLQQGLWTDKGHAQQWVDRIGTQFIVMNIDNPSFSTRSGWSHAYYPSPATTVGTSLLFYNSFAAWYAANTTTSAGGLLDSQANYTVYGSATHRGNVQGWNENENSLNYSYNAHVALAIALRRGLTNAKTAFDRQAAVSGQAGYMSSHPGYNLTFQSSGGSGDPPRPATAVVVK